MCFGDEIDTAAMGVGYLLDNVQSEAGPGALRFTALEPFEDALATLTFEDSRTHLRLAHTPATGETRDGE